MDSLPIEMLPADWALAAIVLTLAVLGLFRGFSGTIAFVVALAAGLFVAAFGWKYLNSYLPVEWQRGAAVLVAALLAFGLVRIIVKKLVNGLLSQPTDAILGLLVGVACGILLIFAWAVSGYYLEYSNLAQEVARHVR